MFIKEKILEKFNSGEIENLGFKRICEVFEAKSNLQKNILLLLLPQKEEKSDGLITSIIKKK